MKLKIALIVIFAMLSMIGLNACGITDKINGAFAGAANITYGIYKDKVKGVQVTEAAKLHGNDISVLIQNGLNKEGFYAKTKACYVKKNEVAVESKDCQMIPINQITDTTNQQYYVNSNGTYTSKLYQDKQGVIRIIEFTAAK